MKSEDLLRAIGDIDESYIAEADSGSVRRTQRWRRYTGWIITAAAAVLVILISVKLLRPVRKSEQLSSANAVAENRTEKEKTAGADYDLMKAEAEEAADYDVAEEAGVEEAAGYDVAEKAAVEEAADYDIAEEAAVEEDAAYEAAVGAMTVPARRILLNRANGLILQESTSLLRRKAGAYAGPVGKMSPASVR